MTSPRLSRVELTKIDRLSPEAWAFWSDLQQSESTLESPFFRPEFTRLVAAARDDVEVALLHDDGGELVGVFPFQRDERQVAWPVGGWFSDYHGVVARPELAYCPRQLLSLCGLAAWRFNHVPQSQTAWLPYRWNWIEASSPYLDLSGGFEAYRQTRRQAHSELLEQTLRKARKMQREIGEIRFVEQTREQAVVESLCEWKIAQYRELGVKNYLGPAWATRFTQTLAATVGEHFSGRLSTLHVGDRLAAACLCARSGGVWHALLMAYNQSLARYSPGLVLLTELAQRCESLGIRKLDLGRGQESYKLRLMSAATPLAEGAVETRVWPNVWRRNLSRTREYARASFWGGGAQRLVRTARAWLAPG